MSIVNLELLRAESHDWPGELAHYGTIMSYVVLQNYSLFGLSFYSYNFHLMVLIAFFLAQRIWCFLWRAAQFSDAHGPRFAVHIVLFFVLLDSLYCAVQLHLKESFAGSLYLLAPVGGSILFYHVHLKTRVYSNVFTTELFSMLSRCLYHSFENWYCIGVLPLKFLPFEYMYIETSRCMMLTGFVAIHSFVMLFCLELHCLGPEILQQTRMLGEWRLADPAKLKSQDPKPLEWSYQNCPYQRGQVVQCKGQFYEAMATFNTSSPSCPSQCITFMTFILADAERTKVLVLAAICCLTIALLPFIIWHNQWTMYAAMLVPIGAHFIFVKSSRYHAFFNPAPLNLEQLQFELSNEMSQYKVNGSGISPPSASSPWAAYADGIADENSEKTLDGEGASDNNSLANLVDLLPDIGFNNQLQCPLFMSAVSASTLFFFGNSGAPRHDASMRGD